jgi:hypothetical protein
LKTDKCVDVVVLRMLYLAFNRSVKQQAKRTFPPNVEVHSWHSLAYNWFLDTHGGRKDQLGSDNYRSKDIWDTVKQVGTLVHILAEGMYSATFTVYLKPHV